jgi:hypothetical protein
MNRARTFRSAFRASYWHPIWIYFTAPTLGMFCTVGVFCEFVATPLRVAPNSTTLTINAVFFHDTQQERLTR